MSKIISDHVYLETAQNRKIIDDVTVVLFDRGDASDFKPKGGVRYEIVPLTPSAMHAADARGLKVPTPGSLFSDFDQARCVVAGRRMLKHIDNSSLLLTLPPSIQLMARKSAWQLAFLEQRLRRTLRKGPWLLRDESGSWILAEDRNAMLKILLPRIWEHGQAHKVSGRRPSFPEIYKWLQRQAACIAGRKKVAWVAAATHKLRAGWRQAIKENGARLVVVHPTKGGWRDYIDLKSPRGDIFVVRVPPLSAKDHRVTNSTQTLRKFGASINDPHLAYAWSLYVGFMAEIVPLMLSFKDEGAILLKLLGVRAVFSFESNSWMSASLNDGAKGLNVPRVVMNHNSQPPSGCALADSVLSTLFANRTCNPLVDVAGIWAPSSIPWFLQTSLQKSAVLFQPVRFDYPSASSQPDSARPFRILHAGNYQNWSDYFPWISETSDEFLYGIERLAEASSKVDGIELIFRVRPKREVDAETLRGRIAERRNLRIVDTEEDFLQQLAGCDLLVAHFSTTVEQALQMGKPVLLWGSTQRYRQFEGRRTLPDADSRAQVYVVSREEDLPGMLAAIRDAHKGRPLSDGETSLYRHTPDAPSVSDWTREILYPNE